jgi:predicted dehydrogenase
MDIRKLLEDKDIDALAIATPDHWHTPMAIMAMQAGVDVYLEKPCCHNPQEGEWLKKVQLDTGRVLQIGNQQRSGPTSIQAVKDIRDGIIGEPYYGKAWYANTRGSIGQGKRTSVPEWLDWELWQGPAPRKQFKDNWVHYNWHWFWHWGTGEINNNGLHEMDICRWALGVGLPEKVTSSGGRFHFDDDWEFYDTQVASFEFPGGKMLTWEGRSCNGNPFKDRGRGSMIHGTDGTILMDRNVYELYDRDNNLVKMVKERSRSATTNTLGIGGLDVLHMKNFANAIRQGDSLNSPVDEAHISTLLCHLGNMAQKYNSTLEIDTDTGRVTNHPESMELWGREYENGWKPTVS